jgi:hypothetical protein
MMPRNLGNMTMRRIATLFGAAALALTAGCAEDLYRLPNTAVMPPGALNTNGDIDVRSLDVAAYGFGHYKEMRSNHALAASSVAALDYMGGQLNTSPRWVSMPALFRLQMLQSREIVRGVLGISQTATSQDVVDTMLALSAAYSSGDQAAITQALSSPIFTVPPAEAAQRLADIPYLPVVNNATTHADLYSFQVSTPGG